jgi:hypothetical protein
MCELVWLNCKQVPKKYFSSISHRKIYLDWLSDKLGFLSPEDWYKLRCSHFKENRGSKLFDSYFGGSPYRAALEYDSAYKWKEWLFYKVPEGFWDDMSNCKRYLTWLSGVLNIKSMSDWYRVIGKDFKKNYGYGLLQKHNCSVLQVLMYVFPEYEWKEWLLVKVSGIYWKNIANRHKYIDWLGQQLGFVEHEDWYRLTVKDFNNHCGGGLLAIYYKSSPSLFVKERFADYQWLMWKFNQTAKGYWAELKNRIDYMKWLGSELKFTEYESWYNLQINDFKNNFGSGMLIEYYNASPFLAAKECFPDFEWDKSKFGKKLKMQKRLYDMVKSLLPKGTKVEWNFKNHNMRSSKGRPIELDIYIPTCKFGIEYQGEQHFVSIKKWGGKSNLKVIKERDKYKAIKCAEHNIKLDYCDYTWDGKIKFVKTLLMKNGVI